jgi:hypothetical protein
MLQPRLSEQQQPRLKETKYQQNEKRQGDGKFDQRPASRISPYSF